VTIAGSHYSLTALYALSLVPQPSDPALGGIASPSRGRGIVPEAERVCRSSDRNTSVSLARLCGARGSDFAQPIANKQNTTGYVGQAARPPGQGPAKACALKLPRTGNCRPRADFDRNAPGRGESQAIFRDRTLVTQRARTLDNPPSALSAPEQGLRQLVQPTACRSRGDVSCFIKQTNQS
jgi:hypothetical protein